MSTDHKISASNLGPIAETEFSLMAPGVTVLVAPNGSGKSILLDAVQAAAKGEGKLPLRDRTRKGRVEAFGATITIGGTCRHTGSFEVTNIEGRFDLAALVDPRLKSAAACDKARIKALVALTGVEASVAMFRNHEAFHDFDTVVTSEALATDDPIEMAAKIKACYDDEALKAERLSEREYGQASALIPASEINLDEESDQAVLQEAYNEARDQVTRLQEQKKNAEAARQQLEKAQKLVDDLGADELLEDREELCEWLEGVDEVLQEKSSEIEALLVKVESLRSEVKQINAKAAESKTRIQNIDRQLKMVEDAKKVLADRKSLVEPEQQDIDDANEQLQLASAAIERGVKIREAKKNAERVTHHRLLAKTNQERALRYRDAGKATDEVLSSCIKCDQVRVESDGKTARLVCDTERGKSIPYHDLSDGERWKLAIDIGADQVGKGGLLVISQVGWEGIDGKNRQLIHDHAVSRGVYILTAEAASDPNASKEIVPTYMGDTDSVSRKPKETAPAPKAEPKAKAKAKEANRIEKTPVINPDKTAEAWDEDIPF